MKKIQSILLIVTGILIITACTAIKSIRFAVGTGDNIRITLKTSNGYDISASIPFNITINGEPSSSGTFLFIYGYNYYVSLAREDVNSIIIEEGTNNNIDYIFYIYDDGTGSQYNYILKITNSNTGILMINIVSEESAKECFDRMSFEKI